MPKYKVTIEELVTYSIEIEANHTQEASEIAASRLLEHDSNSQFSKTTDARSVSVEEVEPPRQTERPPVTAKQRKAAETFLDVLNQVRAEHGDMPAQELKALLTIAMNQNKSIGEYARLLDLPQTSMSQIVKNLGNDHRTREESRGLIDTRPAGDDVRRKEVFLTERGLTLTKKIARIISSLDTPSV